ncbi:hypothetical protein DRJ53_13665 [Paracnuella aquatica]|nr:hypothetical protein DRJ53_13665 [Paracnuella aquatica]
MAQRDYEEEIVYNSATPQGFLADIREDEQKAHRTQSLQFCVSSTPFTVPWPSVDLQRSLLKSNALAMLTPLHHQYLTASGIVQSVVDSVGWKFNFLQKEKDQVLATLINYRSVPLLQKVGIALKANVKLEDLANEERLREALPESLFELKEFVEKELPELENNIQNTTLIYRKLFQEKWNGLVCLKHRIIKESFPSALQGLFEGIRCPEKFFATYLGFDKNKLTATDRFQIDKVSFFGKINYFDAELSTKSSAWVTYGVGEDQSAFMVKKLLVEFENSCITDFDCEVYFKPGRFFEKKADTGDEVFQLKGTYEKKDGVDTYQFTVHKNPLLKINFEKDNIIQSMQLDSVTFTGMGGHNAFLFDGRIHFDFDNPKFKLAGQKLGLFESLYFKNLGFKVGVGKLLLPDFSLFDLTANLHLSQLTDGLLKHFPVKLKNFLVSWKGTYADAFNLDALGFVPISNAIKAFKYGLNFELDLGSLGNLVPEFPSVKADLLLGWDDLNHFTLALRLPTINTNKFSLGIQQVIKIEAENIALGQINNFFFLQLNDCKIFLFGKNLLEDFKNNQLFLAVPTAKEKVKWLIKLRDDQGELIRLLAMGYGVKVAGVGTLRNFYEAFERVKEGLPSGEKLSELATYIDNNAGWQFATHVHINGFADVRVIFSDPSLYGLHLNLVNLFELSILYQRIGNEGLWSIEVPPPMGFRQIEMGAASLGLPNIGLDLFTNGSFKVDLGFPRGFDYSRSGAFQLIPFIGKGGVYFGVLRNIAYDWPAEKGTTTIYAGLALRFGLGKEIQLGPLTAGISLNVYGVLEGAVQLKRQGTALVLNNYKIAGEVGIILELFGSVDFGIVRGGFLVRLGIGQGLVVQKDKAIRLYIKAEVLIKVWVQIRIKAGFIKITITFNFQLRYQLQLNFVLGSDREGKEMAQLFKTLPKRTKNPVLPLVKPSLTLYLVHELTYRYSSAGVAEPQVVFSFAFLSKDHPGCSYHESYRQFSRTLFELFELKFKDQLGRLSGQRAALWIHFLNSLDDSKSATYKDFEALWQDAVSAHFHFQLQYLEGGLGKDTELHPIFFPPLPGVRLKDATNNYGVDFDAIRVDAAYRTQVLDTYFRDFYNYQSTPKISTAGRGEISLVQSLINDYAKTVLKFLLLDLRKHLSKFSEEEPLSYARISTEIIEPLIFGTGITNHECFKKASVFMTGALMSRFLRQGIICPDPGDPVHKTLPFYALTGQLHPLSRFTLWDGHGVDEQGLLVKDRCLTLRDRTGKEVVLHFDANDLDPTIIPQPESALRVEVAAPVEKSYYKARIETPLLSSGAATNGLFHLPLIVDDPKAALGKVSVWVQQDGKEPAPLPSDRYSFCTTMLFGVHRDAVRKNVLLLERNFEGNLQLLNELLRERGVERFEASFFLQDENNQTLPLPGPRFTLLKTNLSEESNPVKAAEDPQPAPLYFADYEEANGKNNHRAFFTLLQHYTIVNSKGFALIVNGSATLEQEHYLLRVVVHLRGGAAADKSVIKTYHNALHVQGYDAKGRYTLQSAEQYTAQPKQHPYQQRWNITRSISPAAHYATHLYGNLAYDLLPASAPITGLNIIQQHQVIPLNGEQEATEKGPKILPYQHTFSLIKYGPQMPALNRYAGVGIVPVARARFYLRDPFGNAFLIPGEHAVMHCYFDPIVGLTEYPGLGLTYTLRTDKHLALTFSFDPGFYLTKEKGTTAIQQEVRKAALEKYGLIRDQLLMDDFTVKGLYFQEGFVDQAPALKGSLLSLVNAALHVLTKEDPAQLVNKKSDQSLPLKDTVYNTETKDFQPFTLAINAVGYIDQFSFVLDELGDVTKESALVFDGQGGVVLTLSEALKDTLRKKGEAYLKNKKAKLLVHYAEKSSQIYALKLKGNELKIPADFSPLSVQLLLERPEQHVDPEVRKDPQLEEVWRSQTEVLYGGSREALAARFEEIFAGSKLGTGLHPQTNRECLWIINGTALQSIALQQTGAIDEVFSFRPLLNQLYSSALYKDMDLDVEMQTITQAVELLLENRNAVQLLVSEEGRVLLHDLLQFKEKIAEVFAGNLLAPVLVGASEQTPSEAVRQKVRFYGKESLKHLYGLDTVLQFRAESNAWPAGSRLYLKAQWSKPNPQSKEYASAFGKLDFSQKRQVHLPLLFNYLPNDEAMQSISEFDVESSFRVAYIEHHIEGDWDEYQPSYWIRLFQPTTTFSIKAAKAPVVLRRYPRDTRVVAQRADYKTVKGTLKQVRLWDYEVTIASLLLPQDDFELVVLKNKNKGFGLLKASAPLNFEAICQASSLWKSSAKELLSFTSSGLSLLKNFVAACTAILHPVQQKALQEEDAYRIPMRVHYNSKSQLEAITLNNITSVSLDLLYQLDGKDISFTRKGDKYTAQQPFIPAEEGRLLLRLKDLDLLAVESVHAGIKVKRNTTFSNASSTLKVNPVFVYETPLQLFGNILYPEKAAFLSAGFSTSLALVPETLEKEVLAPLCRQVAKSFEPGARKIDLEFRYEKKKGLETACHLSLPLERLATSTLSTIVQQIKKLPMFTAGAVATGGRIKVYIQLYTSPENSGGERKLLSIKEIEFNI